MLAQLFLGYREKQRELDRWMRRYKPNPLPASFFCFSPPFFEVTDAVNQHSELLCNLWDCVCVLTCIWLGNIFLGGLCDSLKADYKSNWIRNKRFQHRSYYLKISVAFWASCLCYTKKKRKKRKKQCSWSGVLKFAAKCDSRARTSFSRGLTRRKKP